MKIEEIIKKATLRQFGVTKSQIYGRTRGGIVGDARKAVYLMMKKHTYMGTKAIAVSMKRTDHATTISAVNRAIDLCEVDKHYNTSVSNADDLIERYKNMYYYNIKDYSDVRIEGRNSLTKGRRI